MVGYRFVDDLSTEVTRLQTELPEAAADLEQDSQLLQDFRLSERVDEFVQQLPDQTIGPADAASTAVTYVVAGTLTLFLLLYVPRMIDAGFSQIRDERRRRELRRFVLVALANTRRYVLGSLATMFAIGLIVYLMCRLFDLPAPTPLAVVAGMLSALPYFGVALGALPVLLLSAGLNGWEQTVVVTVVIVVLQVGQVQVLKRVIQPRSLYIGPAVMAIVGLIGFDLYGLGGLLFGAAIGVFLIALGDAVRRHRGVRWVARPDRQRPRANQSRSRPAAPSVEQAPGGDLDLVLGHQDRQGGVAQRDEAVLAGDEADPAVEAVLDEPGDDALAHAARAPGLVHDQDPAGGTGLGHHVGDGQRRQPPEVEDAHAHPLGAQAAGDAQREVQAVGPRHDQQVTALAVEPRRADGHVLRRPTGRAGRRRRATPDRPARAGRPCGTGRWARGTRSRVPSTAAAARHVRSIAAASPGRPGDAITKPGMSRSTPMASSLWKWPPKPFW